MKQRRERRGQAAASPQQYLSCHLPKPPPPSLRGLNLARPSWLSEEKSLRPVPEQLRSLPLSSRRGLSDEQD
jgi:hypothetical protein